MPYKKESIMRIAIACSLVLGAVTFVPREAAAQFAEKKKC
jgi:hypothetical protein